MKFKKDKTGKLEKAVQWCIKKYRPDLACLNFLCVWRDKEKIHEGKLVLAEVYKLPNKTRDVFGYDVMLEVDSNYWNSASSEERKKLIVHEGLHIVVEYELDNSEEKPKEEKKPKTSQEILESYLADDTPVGNPKLDKGGRILYHLVPHSVSVERFHKELLIYGLSEEEEALRQFLNYVHKNVGYTKKK